MSSWIIRLRDLVWPAVLSVALVTASVVVSFFAPSVAIVLGLGGVSFAILAQRA
jgi:hypothetical protein